MEYPTIYTNFITYLTPTMEYPTIFTIYTVAINRKATREGLSGSLRGQW